MIDFVAILLLRLTVLRKKRLIRKFLLYLLLASMFLPTWAIALPVTYLSEPPEDLSGETFIDFTELIPIPKPIAPNVLCNCYAYLKKMYAPALPTTATIRANLKATGAVGNVIVFYYAAVGLPHYAFIIGETATTWTIDEANYVSCRQGTRTVPKNSGSITGYYTL